MTARATVHWYAVTNVGEVHDHAGSWADDSRLVVRYTAKEVTQDVTLALEGKNGMSLDIVTTVAGATAATVHGMVTKRR